MDMLGPDRGEKLSAVSLVPSLGSESLEPRLRNGSGLVRIDFIAGGRSQPPSLPGANDIRFSRTTDRLSTADRDPAHAKPRITTATNEMRMSGKSQYTADGLYGLPNPPPSVSENDVIGCELGFPLIMIVPCGRSGLMRTDSFPMAGVGFVAPLTSFKVISKDFGDVHTPVWSTPSDTGPPPWKKSNRRSSLLFVSTAGRLVGWSKVI